MGVPLVNLHFKTLQLKLQHFALIDPPPPSYLDETLTTTVTRLGFFKGLGHNFFCKSSPNIWDYKKHYFEVQTYWVCILGNFQEIFGYFLFKHLLTLLTTLINLIASHQLMWNDCCNHFIHLLNKKWTKSSLFFAYFRLFYTILHKNL